MKKFILLFSLVLLFGCSQPLQEIKNPEKFTTLEILSNADSTYQVSVINNRVYLLQDGKVKYHLQQDLSSSFFVPVHATLFTIFMVCTAICIILLIVKLTE